MKYDLQYRNRSVGNVVVNKTGLYYEIECCFTENTKRRFNLVAVSSHGEVDLGECRLDTGQFRATRYLPIKAVGHELLRFHIIAAEDKENGYPVFFNRPFPYIKNLEKAVLIIAGGEKRIRF